MEQERDRFARYMEARIDLASEPQKSSYTIIYKRYREFKAEDKAELKIEDIIGRKERKEIVKCTVHHVIMEVPIIPLKG